jgi:hypothetical protein
MTLVYGGAHGDALGAGADGVGCVFDVCARDNMRCWVSGGGRVGRRRYVLVYEEGCADAEEGVWTYSF